MAKHKTKTHKPDPYEADVQCTKEVTLNILEIDAVVTHFARYVRGYEDQNDTRESITDMCEGWDDFVSVVGKYKALQVFWCWARTLPTFKTGMCDPDGN